MRILTILTITVITLGSMLIPAQAGDVVDFLPEVQMARSFELFLNLVQSNDLEENNTFCQNQASLDAIPNQLFINDAGELRSFEETNDIFLKSGCIIELIFENPPDEFTGLFDTLFHLMGGGDLELSNGLRVDGAKQPVRAAVSVTALFGFGFAFDPDDFEFFELLFGEDPCSTLRDFAQREATVELQWLGFLILITDREEQGFCTDQVQGTEAELILLAQQGSLDAALSLVFVWGESDLASGLTSDELNQRMALRATQYFGYDLVTMAAVVAYNFALAYQFD